MPVEFIGMLSTQSGSESLPPSGPVVDKSYIRAMAEAHEQSGFDRVLIGYGSMIPDGFLVASYVSHVTERLGILLAHRPGFVAAPPFTSSPAAATRSSSAMAII
jgi:alkanesulfonate monooxygenase